MSLDPEFPDSYYCTVEELERSYEGTEFHAAYPEKDHLECDFCSKGVHYQSKPRLGHYMADGLPASETPTARQVNRAGVLTGLGTYCDECSTRRLLFPCEGYGEARLFFDLDDDRVIRNVQVTDVSGPDDGIPWDPAELSEEITGVPFEDHQALAGDDVNMGPENIVRFFLSLNANIDIREVVKWDGSLDPRALGRARKAYQQMLEKSQRLNPGQAGLTKDQFRDHIEDGWKDVE